MKFWSSRTLPGQLCARGARMQLSAILETRAPCLRANRLRNCSARKGTSAIRSAHRSPSVSVTGLIRDVGKLTMAACFGDRFVEIHQRAATEPGSLRQTEVGVLGMGHAELSALYLQHHPLPEMMVETARFHHSPALARRPPNVVAAAQIANLILQQAKIGASGNNLPVRESDWMTASGWNILLPGAQPKVLPATMACLEPEIERLRTLLEGLD
jgi:hypothetical protein